MNIAFIKEDRFAIHDGIILSKNGILQIPCCHSSVMTAVAVAGLAVAGAGVGYSMSGAGNPKYASTPNLASSSRQLSDTEAQLLPIERGMAAASQEGGDYTFSLPPGVDGSKYGFDTLPQGSNSVQQTQVFIPAATDINSQSIKDFAAAMHTTPDRLTPEQLQQFNRTQSLFGKAQGGQSGGQWVPYNAADWQTGGKYASYGQPQLRTVTNNNGNYTVSFKGYGNAETQNKIAQQEAANNLALAQKYDPQFIASALKQEQEADPQSFAARQEENDLIQQQMANPLNNPVADILNNQVQNQVEAGKGLDDFDTGVLNNAVEQALKDRNSSGNGADFSQPLTTGAAGVARQQAGIQKGIGELTSGSSPEDIAYRKEQQNLANLSALINGQTPTSEFSSLSGAQRGPTPQVSGQPLPTMGGNTAQTAGSAALGAYGTSLGIKESQANPWLAGITTALNAGNALSQTGYKPFQAPGPQSGGG